MEDVFQPVLQRATYDKSASFDLGQAFYDAAVGATLGGLGGAVDIAGRNAGRDVQSTTAPVQSVEAQTAGVDAPAAKTPVQAPPGPVKVGRVTTIQRPYRGKTPVQTQKSTAAVTVDSGSVRAAQNRIDGVQGLEGAMPGKSFKTTLKEAYKSVFKPVKNVPVSGVTFEGKPYTVDIPGSVPGKVISDPNLTAEKLALLDNLPDVVHNGEYVGSGEYVQHGSKQKKTVRYDYFEALAKIHDRLYMVSFDVEVFPNVNNYRTHKLNEIELSPATDADTGRDPAAGGQETAPVEGTHPLNVDSTISQGAETVNSGEKLRSGIQGDMIGKTDGQEGEHEPEAQRDAGDLLWENRRAEAADAGRIQTVPDEAGGIGRQAYDARADQAAHPGWARGHLIRRPGRAAGITIENVRRYGADAFAAEDAAIKR